MRQVWRQLLVVVFLAGLTSAEVAADERPNIVFILADDLAWSDLACYGNEIHATPHLDRLASEGVRFADAYAPAPICSASRAAILTGKTPARLNFEFVTKSEPGQQSFDTPLQSPPFTLNLPLAEETVGEILVEAGYETAFFGKWHVSAHHNGYLGWSPTHGPRQQGFSTADGDFGSHPYAYRANKSLRSSPVREGEFPADSLIDRVGAFLASDHERPFFLYVSQYFVHDPIHTRCDWLREKYGRHYSDDERVRADYGAMVETLDDLVGRILDGLHDNDLASETIVVFTSDNGGHPNYTANGPLRGSKWNLYEGGIRVPLIVRLPERDNAGVVASTLVHGCDFVPTFAEWAGVSIDMSERDGRSFVPAFHNPRRAMARTEPLVWHFPYYHPEKKFDSLSPAIGIDDFATSQTRPHSAMREANWKLMWFYEDDRIELYDLEKDVGEQRDLRNVFPDLAGRLHRRLATYLSDVNARFPRER